MSLYPGTIRAALSVESYGKSISRAVIGGAVVIYDLDDVPAWLEPILDACDEDGDPSDAISITDYGDDCIVMYCFKGTAITGEAK